MLWLVGIVVGLDYSRLGKLDTDFILWAAVASVLVGFAEESAYRGLTLEAFRSAYPEVRVWLFSTLLFMYLHAFNFIAGQDLGPTIGQLIFTFVLGSVLYAVRRATGTLIIPMILHGAWDFTSFTATSNAFENPDELVDPRQFPIAIGFLIVMAVLFVIGRKQAFAEPKAVASAIATQLHPARRWVSRASARILAVAGEPDLAINVGHPEEVAALVRQRRLGRRRGSQWPHREITGSAASPTLRVGRSGGRRSV